ncbi:ABC-type nitrate/sulfonate/bicarbonate transport system, periplasmic component [Clostridium pasteurianum DSM 525 = ATCC 6013]|uniref:ABC-type nitrate/sulfonate/bicarbonate transport system, periplasmic component n=1 Tax=Clostridium pasteurianum DSM 525 = ATCC 6013 TaxID=1262449 RepID=A0A0H3J570_CLOPA|nr:ABC transporter substrate-binding protein [Clostridium pasteurianum]AJA49091.1 ABC-type nitrate/sulfonate/bicarbonate transport system, periplasmic component [Clostridium pasteurianum DSM 525 = ATCC 6013]AJA53079.1 ABC-type nitrate/sulfonate/bicarbonate transport system, periplasmic component [Clostridium pasteurianum DSM 525 = ATCC 6013]AOZ76292.1 transporter [Clostridium pasteurianum DSM 525 = ATCC 6013]AOZ80088.1 transporter [Clostridium pasteurianum]ELP59028.1 hypothetical protein F502_
MKKLLVLILSVAMTLLTFTGCGKSSTSNATSSTSETFDSSKPYTGKFVNGKLTKPFHLKMPTPTGFTEGIIADQKGFFKEVGIIPEYTGVLPANVSLAQSVIKGDNDLFGSGHLTTIAAVRAAGAKIKVVLTGSVDSPEFDKTHMTWFVKEGSNIKSAKDLVGKKIAMSSKGSCAELWNAEFLRQNGVDLNKTQIVVMNDQQQEQALKQGNIDVAIVHAPYNMKAKNNGGVNILTTSYEIAKGAGNGQLSGVGCRAFSEDFIKKYPDVVKAYIAADVKAQQYVDNHYEEALQIAAKVLKVDVKDTSGSLYAENQKWIIPEQVDFWIKVAERNKFTGFETPGKVKASDLYTNDLNPYKNGEIK